MRITSGRAAGLPLVSPKGNTTRPTTDKVRQAVFNILRHASFWDGFDGANVFDAYCGTGALGIEALSNGADFCIFCDKAGDAVKITQTNLEKANLIHAARIIRHDSTRVLPHVPKPFDLVFLDPPYARGFGEATLKTLKQAQHIETNSLVVFEQDNKRREILPDGFTVVDERIYGDSVIQFIVTA